MNMTGRFWLVTAVSLLAAIGTARLGVWQLDRAAQKTALQEARDSQGAKPALTAAEMAADVDLARAQWHRRVTASGTWWTEGTRYLENRPMDGHAGFVVVTPLVLDDGRTVAVQRGWLPRAASDRTLIAPYVSQRGHVDVAGRIAASLSRAYQMGEEATGPIRQNLDLADYARELNRELLPLVIVQDDSTATVNEGLLRHWPPPASDVQKHFGYAFQWFGLCALVTFLYVWFQFIRPRRRLAT
jgi:surfeit locus 1 family protein